MEYCEFKDASTSRRGLFLGSGTFCLDINEHINI